MSGNAGGNTTGSNSGLQLQYLYSVAGAVDKYLLRDVAQVLNSVSRGRFTGYALMTNKDVINVSGFVDTIARYLLENLKTL